MAAADEQLPSVNKPEESDAVSQPEKSDADGKEAPIDEAKTKEVDKTPAIEEPIDSSKTAEDDSHLGNGRTRQNGENPKSPALSTAGSPKPVSIPEAQLDENKDLDEVNGDNTTDKPDLDAKASSFESESASPVEAEALVSQKKSREDPDTEPVVSPTTPTQSEEPLNEDPIKETEEAVASCTVANSSLLKPKAEPVELDPEKSVESIEAVSEVKQELVTVFKLTVAAKDKESATASKSRRKDTLAPEPLQETLEDANTDNQGRRRSLRIRSSSSKKYTETELGDEEPECIPLDPPTPSPAKDLKDPLLVGRKASIITTKPSKPSFRISDLPLPKSISMTPVTLKKEPQQQPMLLPQPPASSAHAGFVIIDTTSLLAGKGPVPVSVPSLTTSAASPIILNPPPTPVRLMGGNKAPSSRIKTHQISSSASTSCSTPSSTNSSNSTADLFAKHGLTDDSYIVEAPSFIVPYIIEKSGEKSLKKFLDTEKENKEEESKKKKLQQLPKKVEKSPKKDRDVIMVSEGEEEEEEDEEEEDEDREEDSSESEANPTAKTTSKPINRFTGDAGSYFETPLGTFFADIGLGLVQEFMQDDMLRIQKRRLAKGGRAAAAAMAADTGMSVAALEKNLQVSRTKNQAYHLDKVHKCNLCSFKTESVLVLSHHREAPHIQGNRYLCNFCSMETREAAQALVHMLQHHGIRGRVEPHIFFHQCIFCPFEDHLKTKVTRHVFTCQKRFRPERNMEPPADWEPPAKIPRMPNRPQKGLHGIGGAMNALGPSSPFGAPGKLTHLPSMVHPLLGKSHLSSLGLPPLIPANGMSSANTKNNRNNNYNNAAAAAALAGIKLPSEKSNKGGAYRNSALYLPTNYAVQGNIYQLMNSTGGVMPMLPSLPLLSKKSANNAVSITPTTATLVPSLAHSSSLSISGSSGGIMTATAMSSSSSSSKSSSRLPQQPSISITPLPRPSAANAGSSSSAASASAKASSNAASAMSVRAVSGSDANAAAAMGIKAGQPAQPGQKTNLVICEICDGCIKDLEQLRNHMHWIHKVKIHPKMIHNRPPLNCQKCQFRFFTDQGLERHLLGSHGLVTSSMQESANKGQDGGRCPICGKVYQWKLLSHVAKDHGLTLKPAHLSYKCTVCTATFNMYKLFENHVYTAHSVVAKKVLDKKGGAEGSRAESNHTSSGKSLKINDEITIIPQPARGSASASTSASSSSTVSVSVSVSAINKGDETDKSCQGCGQNLERHRRDRDYCSTCARKMRDPLREPSQEKDEDHGSSRRRRRERKGEAVDVIDLSGDEDGGAANVPVSIPLGKSEITITKVKATSSSLEGGKHSGVQLIRLPEGTKSNAAATLHAGDVEMTVSVSKVSQRKRPANEEVTGGAGKRPRHD